MGPFESNRLNAILFFVLFLIFVMLLGGIIFSDSGPTQKNNVSIRASDSPDHREIPRQELLRMDWKEIEHDWSYAYCMALTKKNITYCDYSSHVEECKQEMDLYRHINEEEYQSGNSRVRMFLDAVLSGDKEKCRNLEREDWKHCHLLVSDSPPSNCSAIENTNICDDWNEMRAKMTNDVKYCNRIKSNWSKTECTLLISKSPEYCKKRVRKLS